MKKEVYEKPSIRSETIKMITYGDDTSPAYIPIGYDPFLRICCGTGGPSGSNIGNKKAIKGDEPEKVIV